MSALAAVVGGEVVDVVGGGVAAAVTGGGAVVVGGVVVGVFARLAVPVESVASVTAMPVGAGEAGTSGAVVVLSMASALTA
jgi:hypothetical protein